MKFLALALLSALSTSCCKPPAPSRTSVIVSNRTKAATAVYVAFGADSKVTAKDWKLFCSPVGVSEQSERRRGSEAPPACTFPLAAGSAQPLPTGGAYLNATFSFGAPVTCGVTKAEVNLNNPAWFDTYDVSLVDGYSNPISIVYTPPTSADAGAPVTLGPPKGAAGNEKVLGVFPLGCDICVARQNPPCNLPKGKDGCKEGTQNDPHPPCQVQGAVKGGGGSAEVVLNPLGKPMNERDEVTVLRTHPSDWITAKELREMGFDLPLELPDGARTLKQNLVRDPGGGKVTFRDGKMTITGLTMIRGGSDFIVPLAPGEEPRPGGRVCLEWDAPPTLPPKAP